MNNKSDDYRSVPLDDYVKLSQSYWELVSRSMGNDSAIHELRAQVLVMETREQDLASERVSFSDKVDELTREVERLQDLNRELTLASKNESREWQCPPTYSEQGRVRHDYDG